MAEAVVADSMRTAKTHWMDCAPRRTSSSGPWSRRDLTHRSRSLRSRGG